MLTQVSRIFLRRMTSCPPGSINNQLGIVPNNARYQKLQEAQNLFCRDDGNLVWQKMGGSDKAMYMGTMALMVGGFIPSLGTILVMSFPST